MMGCAAVVRMSLVLCVTPCSFACGRSDADTPASPVSAPAPAPAAAASAAPTPEAPPALAAEVAAEPPPGTAVVAAPVAPEGPPRKVVTADGIRITETSDGRVILTTTALWGEAIDSTYSDCGFYTAAIPVLEKQIAPERAKLLTRVCAGEASKPTP